MCNIKDVWKSQVEFWSVLNGNRIKQQCTSLVHLHYEREASSSFLCRHYYMTDCNEAVQYKFLKSKCA